VSLWWKSRRLLTQHHRIHTELQRLSTQPEWAGRVPLSGLDLPAIGELFSRLDEVQERRQLLTHLRLQRDAVRFHIPLPELSPDVTRPPEFRDANWERLKITQSFSLRPEALRKLRAEIREERRARWDYLLGWVTPFVSIAGVVVGAILGYFLGVRK
jgi:hypothetical protein